MLISAKSNIHVKDEVVKGLNISSANTTAFTADPQLSSALYKVTISGVKDFEGIKENIM